MKQNSTRLVFMLLAGLLLTLSGFAQSAKQTVAMTDRGWPRTFASGGTSFSIYQPQIERWKDNRFEARAAVAGTTVRSKQTAYGVIWFAARTEIDKLSRPADAQQIQNHQAARATGQQRWESFRSSGGLGTNSGFTDSRIGSGSGGPRYGSGGAGGGVRGGGRIRR